MKILFLLLMSLSVAAQTTVEDCIKEAEEYGDNYNVRVPEKCRWLIESHPEKIKVVSPSGRYRITAYGNIVYIDTYESANDPLPKKREVLAGDETGLSDIKKIWFHEKKQRFLVLMGGSTPGLATFTLEYAANTAPLRHIQTSILEDVDEIKLLDDRDEIALMNRAGTVRFINADADNVRYKLGNFKPKLLRQFHGEKTQLSNPRDVVIPSDQKDVFVLDAGRVLVFNVDSPVEATPRKILPVPSDVARIEWDEGKLLGVTARGEARVLLR